MLRNALILAALASSAACQPKTSPASSPEIPRLAGSVGQLAAADAFLTFIHAHQRQTVVLELQLPDKDFQVIEQAGATTFDVWEECDNLPPGQKPSTLAGGCTGFEFTVPNFKGAPRQPLRDGNLWRLSGLFRVEPAGGPLQGLMIVKLTPIVPPWAGGRR